jgi:hypothetical protein
LKKKKPNRAARMAKKQLEADNYLLGYKHGYEMGIIEGAEKERKRIIETLDRERRKRANLGL